MYISCPVCKFKGSISDDLIPEQGKRVRCPRCRAKHIRQETGYIVERPERTGRKSIVPG